MTGLTAIRETLGPALKDARSIIAQYWLIGSAIAAATYLIVLHVLATWHNPNTANWLALPGFWAVGFLCYVGAMRRVLAPEFRLSSLLLTRFVGLTLLTYGLILLFAIPFGLATIVISMSPALKTVIVYAAYYALTLFVGTKLAFAPFALDSWGVFASCARSWDLTGKQAFWPTFLAYAPFAVVWFVIAGMLTALRHVAETIVWATIKVPLEFGTVLAGASLTYSILARLMPWCEELHFG